MGWKVFFGFIFLIFIVAFLAIYWFFPVGTTEFVSESGNSNFSLNQFGTKNMQFYENMRFPDSRISYKIENCPLQKKEDMETAFSILSEKTPLRFYPSENEEISITCDSRNKIEGGLFIAGEGGPTNITLSGNFKVILSGKILLIKESNCPTPNIALHELLHVLGFNHSENSQNIMYYLSDCDQIMGVDQIELIEKLYEFPPYPDLFLENVSAIMHGRYLDTNISIKNIGLKNSENFSLLIYADDKLVKDLFLENMNIGTGKILSLTNVLLSTRNIEKLNFVIEYPFGELEKQNNNKKLEIKK